jgi:quinoprotein dehydrogenase-associated probable ABC transporter substrate-binding protein
MMRRATFALFIGAFATPPAKSADTNMTDAVNHRILRVCATRSNLPYSNEKGEGFENKIANILGAELGIPVKYTWAPQGPGLIEQNLDVAHCDVVIGTAQTEALTLNTNHYYRTTYALVHRPDQGLDGITSLSDARLAGKRIGIQSDVPALGQLVKAGLMPTAKLYPLWVDTRYENPMRDMVRDIRAGEIDAGVLWGPYAGYYATRDGEKLVVVPLLEEVPGTPKLEYRITMGVRLSDSGFKRRLNEIIAKRRSDMEAVLRDYGVPLIDEDNKLIAAPAQ